MRERLIVVGNRIGVKFQWPTPTHFVKNKSMAGVNNSFVLSPNEQDCVPALSVMEALSDLPSLKAGESKKNYLKTTNLTEYQKYLRQGSNSLNNHDSTVHSAESNEKARPPILSRRFSTSRRALRVNWEYISLGF